MNEQNNWELAGITAECIALRMSLKVYCRDITPELSFAFEQSLKRIELLVEKVKVSK